MNRVLLPCVVALFVLAAPLDANAWHAEGHVKAVQLAVKLLDGKMPTFFLAGGLAIEHCCHDPDLFSSMTTPQLNKSERPEHYIDLDCLENRPLPDNRYEYLALCRELRLNPAEVGLLPYAVTEWTQRLTVAFAEYRRWPKDLHVQAKCLVYAGILAHYAADASQPLHLTIHHDGRVGSSGQSPRSGIHMKVDSLLGKLKAKDEDLLAGLVVSKHTDSMKFLLAEIDTNRELIDEVYELENSLPGMAEPLGSDAKLTAFVTERMRSATRMVASLFLSAWENSASVELPTWHTRP